MEAVLAHVDARNLDEIGHYVISSLLDDARATARLAEQESDRGNKRLCDMIEDIADPKRVPQPHNLDHKGTRWFLGTMSDRLRNLIEPYGMSRECSFSPYY